MEVEKPNLLTLTAWVENVAKGPRVDGSPVGGTINKHLECEGTRLISSQLDGLWGSGMQSEDVGH